MALGQIPVRDIRERALALGLDRVNTARFVILIRELDAEWLRHQAAEMERKGST